MYYELSDDQMNSIAAENEIDTTQINTLAFYTLYGGKLVAGAIIALIIYGAMPKKKKKIEPKNI